MSSKSWVVVGGGRWWVVVGGGGRGEYNRNMGVFLFDKFCP